MKSLYRVFFSCQVLLFKSILATTTDDGSQKEEEIAPCKCSYPQGLIIFLSVLSSVFFIFAIGSSFLAYRMWREKSSVLTREEISMFLNGERRSTEPVDHFSSVGFDEKFKIKKEDLIMDQGNILGMGNFGCVYKAQLRGANVAVKTTLEFCRKETFRRFLYEVKLLSYLGEHDNVIKFFGAYTERISQGVIYVALQLCEIGSLQSYLRRERQEVRCEGKHVSIEMGNLDSQSLVRFCREIASGMEYIESKKVVHGDLSSRNILLDENYTCKISDFSLSRRLYEYTKYVKESQEPLPWRWMAYESLKLMEFTTKTDMWSYGITLWEIFTLGDIPYPGLNWNVDFVQELRNGLRMGKPPLASKEIFSKMIECWNLDPAQRPSFNEMNAFFTVLTAGDYVLLE